MAYRFKYTVTDMKTGETTRGTLKDASEFCGVLPRTLHTWAYGQKADEGIFHKRYNVKREKFITADDSGMTQEFAERFALEWQDTVEELRRILRRRRSRGKKL